MALVWLMEKKGLLGGFTTLSDRREEKGEATHVQMDVDEYDALMWQISDLRWKLQQQKNDFAQAKKNQDRIWEERNWEIIQEADARVAEAESKVAEAERLRSQEQELNVNLLRIAKERANAARGLHPKKTHPGYRLVGRIMPAKVYQKKDKNHNPVYAEAWTAVLESPYDITLPLLAVECNIMEALKADDGILAALGLRYWECENGDIWRGRYKDMPGDMDQRYGYVTDYSFMGNTQTRLWEVKIVSTKPVKPTAELL